MKLFGLVDLRSQRGLTVLELMIAMAITAAVLSALTGVIFSADDVSRTWGQRVYDAGAEEMLPDMLQADTHRYLVCSGAGSYTLQLCVPGTSAPAVTYGTDSACSAACDVVRTLTGDGSQTVVARGLLHRPQFSATCTQSAGATSGVLQVTGLIFPPGMGGAGSSTAQSPLVVYFNAPLGGCTT